MAVCADVGSTYTKVAVVDLAAGALVATAAHPTTVGTDVLHGLDAAVEALAERLPGHDLSNRYVCSSAGGGLRLAVVGYEALVSAEAAHRVATSAGARVVHVAAGRLDAAATAALRAATPDVVLLVGGTDGGDAETVRHNGARLAAARLRVPVVVAGNADARDDVTAALAAKGVPVVATGNVLPRIGVLAPGPARAAIREVFLRHVIGGKGLSRGRRFAGLVRAATPDAVLAGVELLAGAGAGADSGAGAGDFAVVDVGGATTDVYSVITPDAERTSGPAREVAGVLWRSRTVEGDLGVRWSAPGVVAAARAEKLIADAEAETLAAAADARAAEPGMVADDPAVDLRLAGLAATIAVRRHARGEPGAPGAPRRGGKDLSRVRVLIGSGGVLRYAPPAVSGAVLGAVLADHEGGWRLPTAAVPRVDRSYVLAAIGLLATDFPAAAVAVGRRELHGQSAP
ncbi:glutamate mutase [Planosporangium mesophilum]|nr:glutamate mutase L [Planosporangium mesophilum]NJC83025.1 glutamate mutase [Planosporangium mesophilum]